MIDFKVVEIQLVKSQKLESGFFGCHHSYELMDIAERKEAVDLLNSNMVNAGYKFQSMEEKDWHYGTGYLGGYILGKPRLIMTYTKAA